MSIPLTETSYIALRIMELEMEISIMSGYVLNTNLQLQVKIKTALVKELKNSYMVTGGVKWIK